MKLGWLSQACQDYSKESVLKCGADDRQAVEDAVASFVAQELVLPPVWQASRIVWSARHAQSLTEWVSILKPVLPADADDSFDAKKPALACAALSATDKAKILLRAVVHDQLIPQIVKGEEGVQRVAELARAVLQMRSDLPGDMDTSLYTTIGDLGDIALTNASSKTLQL